MAGAKVKNPRKKFLWQIIFVKHPINPFLFQKVTVPEISIEQVARRGCKLRRKDRWQGISW